MPWIQTSALALSRVKLVRQDLLVQAQCHVDKAAQLPGTVLAQKELGIELGLVGSELMSSKISSDTSTPCFSICVGQKQAASEGPCWA